METGADQSGNFFSTILQAFSKLARSCPRQTLQHFKLHPLRVRWTFVVADLRRRRPLLTTKIWIANQNVKRNGQKINLLMLIDISLPWHNVERKQNVYPSMKYVLTFCCFQHLLNVYRIEWSFRNSRELLSSLAGSGAIKVWGWALIALDHWTSSLRVFQMLSLQGLKFVAGLTKNLLVN